MRIELEMKKPTKTKSSWSCFSPTLGIFTGIFLGWVLHFFLPTEQNIALDLATRTLDMIVALVGWAVGTALYGKQIHCGGSKVASASTRHRYATMSAVILPMLMLAPVLLITEQLFWYYFVAIALLAMIAGEIKSEQPLWFLKGQKL